jgi:hypothetical protein
LGVLKVMINRIWDCSWDLTPYQKWILAEELRDLADDIERRPN